MVFAKTIVRGGFPRITPRILNHSSADDVDRQASGRLLGTMHTQKRRRFRLARGVSLFWRILSTAIFLISLARAQDQPSQNEYAFWLEGQLGNGHAFASTTDTRMYQIEGRYGRLVYTNRLLALRYIAEVIPLSVVGDPQANGQRAYAHATGGSPIGAQINFLYHRRVQPFLTSGGGFLYFDRRMFGATQFNFTAQVAGGVQVFTSRHRSVQFGYEYHHISNANLGRVNPGMDSHVIFVGLSFVR